MLPYRMKLTHMYLKAGVGMQIVYICVFVIKEPAAAAAYLNIFLIKIHICLHNQMYQFALQFSSNFYLKPKIRSRLRTINFCMTAVAWASTPVTNGTRLVSNYTYFKLKLFDNGFMPPLVFSPLYLLLTVCP